MQRVVGPKLASHAGEYQRDVLEQLRCVCVCVCVSRNPLLPSFWERFLPKLVAPLAAVVHAASSVWRIRSHGLDRLRPVPSHFSLFFVRLRGAMHSAWHVIIGRHGG